MESPGFPSNRSIAIPICLFPNVVPVLVYLAVNWEGVLPVGVGVGQHDHVALSKKAHRLKAWIRHHRLNRAEIDTIIFLG